MTFFVAYKSAEIAAVSVLQVVDEWGTCSPHNVYVTILTVYIYIYI